MSTPFPSREGLIIGAAIIALHGVEQEMISTMRAHGNANWNEDPRLLAVRGLSAAIRAGRQIIQEDSPTWDALAFAQQTLRVSIDEWFRVLKITPLTESKHLAQL